MKFSDKYKANAFMVAGLSCFYPLGSAISSEPKIVNLTYWILYAIIAIFGLLIVYAAYKECKAKEENKLC